MNVKTYSLAGIGLFMAAVPAFAHHSFAMFDVDQNLKVAGTVMEYEWTNPHVWIHVMAADSTDKPVEWSFELQSVESDTRAGWRADTLKPGDKITIEYHPLKDGSRGGQLVSAVLPSGKQLGHPNPITPVPR
jgi:hypothetical protein